MREFRQDKGRNGTRYWKVWFEAAPGKPPEEVFTEWGAVVDGKRNMHGRTSDKPGPKGKRGTKAFVNAVDNAAFHMDRMIRKKMEEGYVEVGLDGRSLVGGTIEVPPTEIDFTKPLPKNLCFSKPKNDVAEKYIRELEAKGRLLYTRKVNGMMVIAYRDADGDVSLYSRRIDDLTEHFPNLVKAINDLSVPPKSILLFEAFMGEGKTHDDLLSVQAIMRSKPQRAVDMQKNRGWVKFYIIRLPVWKGVYVEKTKTTGALIEALETLFTDRFLDYDDKVYGKTLYPIEPFEGSYDEAMALAERENYEGWVVYDKEGCLGEYSFGFHGKPDRPKCCFKAKADAEDDFVCYWDPDNKLGSWGTGKNQGKVGTLSLFQYGPKGKVYICEVGSGLTDEDRERLTHETFPKIAIVKFQSRSFVSKGADSNALFLPRIVGFRQDKGSPECWHDDLIAPA